MNTLQKYEKFFYIIILIGVVIYFPIFFNGFVWDDYPFLIDNAQVHQINIPAIFGPSVFNLGPFYRPIPSLYFTLLYHFSGIHAVPYHLIQLVLHLICSILLFLFFCLFFSENISFFLALIFLVHPMNVESVAYIGSTINEISFLPGIIALLLAKKKEVTKNKLFVIIALICFSIFTKETGFLFIPLIVLYRYLFKLGKVKEFLLSGISIIVFYLLIRVFVGHVVFSESTVIPIAALPLQARLINIPAILIYYTQTFFFPLTLTIWQSWIITKITLLNFYTPLFVCLVITALIIFGGIFFYKNDRKSQSKLLLSLKGKHIGHSKYVLAEPARFPQYLFFFVWLILGLGMLLQIAPLDMTVADRWFYFPIVGFLGMIGVILTHFLPSIKKHYKIYSSIAIIILCLLSLRTFVRTFDWKNNITLYADARHPGNNYMLDNVYAIQLFSAGKQDEAIIYTRKSIAIFSTMQNIGSLGVMYRELGQCDKAIPILNQALTYYNPADEQNYPFGDIYLNLINCYIQEGQQQNAIDFIKNKALKRFPRSGQLYVSLAIAYSENNEEQQAINAITKAYLLDQSPDVKRLYNQLKNNYIVVPDNNPSINTEPTNPSGQNQTPRVNPQIFPQPIIM